MQWINIVCHQLIQAVTFLIPPTLAQDLLGIGIFTALLRCPTGDVRSSGRQNSKNVGSSRIKQVYCPWNASLENQCLEYEFPFWGPAHFFIGLSLSFRDLDEIFQYFSYDLDWLVLHLYFSLSQKVQTLTLKRGAAVLREGIHVWLPEQLSQGHVWILVKTPSKPPNKVGFVAL